MFVLSLAQWIMFLSESEAACEPMCVTFDRGMFFIVRSSIFIFSGRWLLCCTALIQTARGVWIARLRWTKHGQTV